MLTRSRLNSEPHNDMGGELGLRRFRGRAVGALGAGSVFAGGSSVAERFLGAARGSAPRKSLCSNLLATNRLSPGHAT